MGTVTKKTLGTPHGAFQDYVFFEWRGKASFRSRAKSIYDPKTPTQISNRNKFKLISKLTRPLAAIIKAGFKSSAKYGYKAMSAANAFVSYNLDIEPFSGQGPDEWVIDFEKLAIAQGSLSGFNTAKATLTPVSGENDVVFTWTSDESADPDDQVYCVILNKDLNLAKYLVAIRSEGTASLPIADYWLENSAKNECYIFAFDGKNASQSLWLNEVFD